MRFLEGNTGDRFFVPYPSNLGRKCTVVLIEPSSWHGIAGRTSRELWHQKRIVFHSNRDGSCAFCQYGAGSVLVGINNR